MDPLELGKVFVKTVVRMFYETEHTVVVDALIYHGAHVNNNPAVMAPR
jgi:transcription initiation factor TFIIE subunit alpha